MVQYLDSGLNAPSQIFLKKLAEVEHVSMF